MQRITSRGEHSAWRSAPVKVQIPGLKLFGRWQLIAPSTETRRVEVVRLYPKSFGLPGFCMPENVISVARQEGYLFCPPEVIKTLATSGEKTRRRGYIVAPVARMPTEWRVLFVWDSGRIAEIEPELFDPLKNRRWSVIMAKCWY